MNIRAFAHTDIGRVRQENQDAFLLDDELRLYAVADGIGGLPAGAQASKLTLTALREYFVQQKPGTAIDYDASLEEANSPRLGIGSTLTFAHLVGDHINFGHVGDSRLIRFRDSTVTQITSDHTLENEFAMRLERGESPLLLIENKNALTRCIGQPPPVCGDFESLPMLPGDRYLIASDGVTRLVSTEDMAILLDRFKEPEKWVRTMVDTANERGGFDNITALAIFAD
jgi:serine/threonine protein phosphatase PrpC